MHVFFAVNSCADNNIEATYTVHVLIMRITALPLHMYHQFW